MAETPDNFITLARLVKTQGRHGEVAAESYSNVAGRFVAGMKLLASREDGSLRDLQISEAWLHKGHVVLKFDGIDSISDAEALIGCRLQVPASERPALESGWTYAGDLIGCMAFDGDREIGIVEDVQSGAGEAPLLVIKAGRRLIEIPFAEAYLQEVDLKRKQIRMALPEGMLELDAPLTAEEKAQQKRE
jgi:16S rRNA processing protein RimM